MYIIFSIISPSGGISNRRVDVFEGNGEMYDEEIEVFNAPVRKLLLANWLYFVAVVEGIPEFANNEEVFALDKAIFDCSCYSLASFLLIPVICKILLSALTFIAGSGDIPHAPSNNRYPVLIAL